MTLFVVPDSNALYSDLFLEHPPLSTILLSEQMADVRLLLPAVVVDELRQHLRERIENVAEDARKYQRGLTRLAGRERSSINLGVTLEDKQFFIDRFETRMQQFAIEQRVLPYPNIPLNELSKRSYRMQRPFISKDRGMRDTLIWLSVKEYLNEIKDTNSIVVLISKDGAFFEEKGKDLISKELVREIEDAGLSMTSFRVERELQSVIDNYISNMVDHAHRIQEQIEGMRIAGFRNNDKMILNLMNDWLIDHSVDLQGLARGFPIQGFHALTSVRRVGEVRTLALDDGKVVVSSDWRGDLPIVFNSTRAASQFGDFLSQGAAVEFTVSSLLVDDGDRWSIQSHEVTRTHVMMV